MSTRLAPALALLGIAWGGELAAQDVTGRMALERLRDSIAFTTDTTALLALEAREIAVARARRDDPLVHLRLGLVALRLAALRPAGRHLDDAIGEFEWAAELAPDWPWPWYGLGLAEARAADRAGGFAGGLWTMLGLDRDRVAGRAFARAVSADPTFIAGLVEFARIALEQRIDAPLGPARDALRAATATPVGWHPELLLMRGRVERLAGHPDSARVAFERALLTGARRPVVQLELARTLPLVEGVPAAAAAEAYYAAARAADRDVMADVRRDLEPIARRDELAVLDSLEGAAREEWLRDYWLRTAARDLRRPDERLAEHFRRWDVARREFRLPPFRRRYRWGLEIYQSGDPELDDRGVIWLRQGAPTMRLTWPRVEYLRRPDRRNFGNETWRYDRPEGPMVLHFVAHEDPQDYRAVESAVHLDVPIWVLEQHAHEVPGLQRMLRAGPATAPWVTEEVRLQDRASLVIATRTTGWGREYPSLLTGRAQWLAAGTRAGQPLAHLVLAMDADSLRAAAARTGAAALPVRLRASVLDRRGAVVATLDTLQEVPVPSPSARLVALRAEVPVAPGALRIRYGVEAGDSLGAVYPVDSILAPAVDGRRLEASALLVGREGRSLPWAATPRDTAWLDAGGAYPAGDTLTVYAEAYGLRPGAPVDVAITLTRERGGVAGFFLGRRGEAVALRERLTADEPTLRIRRAVGLASLEPGRYAVELEVRSRGASVVRHRGITIVP